MQTVAEDLFGGAAEVLDIAGVVEHLADGDTLTVRSGSRRLRVRMLGMDAPELHYRGQSQGPWAEAALRQLRLLAPLGARVRLVTDRQIFDQYGRLLAHVLRGQRNLNLEMLRAGWAVSYPIYPNVTLLRQTQAASAAAEARGFGIFDPRAPLPLLPYEFRQRVDNRPPAKVCGDARTRRYYPPHEYQRVPVAWRVFFYTEADARAFGYVPAITPTALPVESAAEALVSAAPPAAEMRGLSRLSRRWG